MKREDAIGLFGIGMWLLGVLIIGAGLCGLFDVAKAAPFVAEATHGQCTTIYPRGVKVPKVTKKLPVCTGGDTQASWRGCTTRYIT